MLFNSIAFVAFLPITFFLYWSIPGRFRPALLLLASCYFYISFVPAYLLVLFFLITVDYLLGIQIERASAKSKRYYFIVSIISNIGILFFFKYFDFFSYNVSALAQLLHWNYSPLYLQLLLPLGLSFHTFQSLSYIIEVYKGRYPAERNYLFYALYVMFFPQLVAGPIERPAQLLPQLHAVQQFQYQNALAGLKMIAWGFFKKIVIANQIALVVDFVFARAGTADASAILVAVLLFPFQLYADFSGYCDIAIGSARMLGIELVQNFRQPFFSRSIAEFWRRWHISLSNWFRDYVFSPLAFSFARKGSWGISAAVFLTFTLVGFWHGAGWTYLIMGMLFGLYICVGTWTQTLRTRVTQFLGVPSALHVLFQVGITFLLTAFAQIFFRASTLTQAWELIRGLLIRWGSNSFSFLHCSDYCSVYSLGLSRKGLLCIGLSLALLLGFEYLQHAGLRLPGAWRYRFVRWSAYYALVVWILVAGNFAPITFIYFQF